MKYLILLAFLSTQLYCKAQSYIPMTETALWVYSGSWQSQTYHFHIWRFMLMINGDDTSINGLTYKKITARQYSNVVYYKSDFSLPYDMTIANVDDKYFGAIREDNKKVYIRYYQSTRIGLPTADTAEQLYFDFNLTVGDITPKGDSIVSIDSVLVGNNYRRRFKTSTLFMGKKIEHIEGIGSNVGLIDYAMESPPFTSMHCYHIEDTVYTNPYNPTAQYPCFYIHAKGTPVSVQAFNKADVQVYPNPVLDRLYINAVDAGSITIFNSLGQVVIKKDIEPGNTEILFSDFANGVYFLQLKDTEGNIRHSQRLLKQ